MSIYLGDAGHIELQRREVNNVIARALSPDDVDAFVDRFSFDGLDSESLLLTGDRVRFERIDGGNIELIDGITDQTGVTRYVHVDPIGGIRLYKNFNDAVAGELQGRESLVTPSDSQDIEVHLESVDFKCMAQVQNYSITTSRETLDLTELGDEFRRNYASGLVNGQGECSCIWDYETTGGTELEFAQYLVQLVLRLQLGATFNGKFFIKSAGRAPIDSGCLAQGAADDAIWWEAQCIVTNVAMQFSPSEIVTTQVQFVTTDKFQLKSGTPPSYLTQDPSNDLILQDDNEGKIVVEQLI